MSVRFHLSLQPLLDKGYEVKDNPNGYPGFMLGDSRVSVNERHAFVDIGRDLVEVRHPADIDLGLVECITSHHTFPVQLAVRRTGEYRHQQASAILERVGNAKANDYRLSVSGTNLEDMQALYRNIRTGSIWPTVDYEGEMVPPPCRHLRQLVREAWAIFRRDMILRLRRA